jgi:hypothetical protein
LASLIHDRLWNIRVKFKENLLGSYRLIDTFAFYNLIEFHSNGNDLKLPAKVECVAIEIFMRTVILSGFIGLVAIIFGKTCRQFQRNK